MANSSNPKIKLKTGDTVMVRTGKDRGKVGKITAVHPKANKVTVEGVNVVTKHRRPTQSNSTGGIEERTMPIDISKVGIVHPDKKGATSRIGYKVSGDKKQRIYRQAKDKVIK